MLRHSVYLGIGSNIDPESHIGLGLDALANEFGQLSLSSVYQSPAIGFEGPDFLNLVVHVSTSHNLLDIADCLRNIEVSFGRRDFTEKYSSRSLDIDLLTYDDFRGQYRNITLPRPEIRVNAHVLCPFAELAPEFVLPGEQVTLKTLWANYPQQSQPLKKTGFVWQNSR